MASINDLTLASKLTERVSEACIGLENGDAPILSQVSETTVELLRFWFQQDYIDNRGFNFHEGQRKAILNVIYAHEVLGMTDLERAIYQGRAGGAAIERASDRDYQRRQE